MSASRHRCLAVGDGTHGHRTAERGRQGGREFPRQRLGSLRPPAPDRDLADRPHLGMDADEMRRQRAGADHQQPRRRGGRQIARGQARGAGGAPLGQHRAVEQRQRPARCGRRAAGTGRSTDGSDRLALSGKTVTSLMPTAGGPVQAGISSSMPLGQRVMMARAASRSRPGTAPRGGRSARYRRAHHRPRRPTGSSFLEGLGRDQCALPLDRPLIAGGRSGPAAARAWRRPGAARRLATSRSSRATSPCRSRARRR